MAEVYTKSDENGYTFRGKDVYISPTAVIRGLTSSTPKRLVIGDGTYIGDGVQIILDDFEIGDYCKIHNNTTLHGYKPLKIGHNAWIGQGTIIDSIGGTTIGDNCGIGAYSQLWSHIRYGDVLEGCNYNQADSLVIGNDVWFVGHCIVSPITAKDKSMALVGSVITRDMEENRIYGGSPAKDLTEKLKPQFSPISLSEKWKIVNSLDKHNGIKFVDNDEEVKLDDHISYFNIVTRKYTKKRTQSERTFMKYLIQNLIRFTPGYGTS